MQEPTHSILQLAPIRGPWGHRLAHVGGLQGSLEFPSGSWGTWRQKNSYHHRFFRKKYENTWKITRMTTFFGKEGQEHGIYIGSSILLFRNMIRSNLSSEVSGDSSVPLRSHVAEACHLSGFFFLLSWFFSDNILLSPSSFFLLLVSSICSTTLHPSHFFSNCFIVALSRVHLPCG